MDFALGLGTGLIIMWAIAMRLKVEWKKEVELLKDFDTWKEWKNNNITIKQLNKNNFENEQ